MNYLIYPIKIMNITQTYKNDFSHSRHTVGTPKDYPIDDNCGATGPNGYFYCPCDAMTVKKIYGVGSSSSNVLWLESTTPVITPTFTDYVTIMIGHIEDAELNKLKIGQTFTRKEPIAIEGKDGFATGEHFHIVVGRGKFRGSGWVKNTNDIWVINTTGGSVKPEDAFFIDNTFTTIKNSAGLNFLDLYIPDIEEDDYYYTTAESLNIRLGPGTNYNAINTLPKNSRIKVREFVNNWARITDKEYVASNYVTKKEPSKYYETKSTTADFLNVRSKPAGTILKVKAPLPKGTTVAVMEEKNGWTKINTNRWVYSSYVK